MCAGQGWILPLETRVHFFFGPWLIVCQFIEIFNQMELNGKVSNFEKKEIIKIGIIAIILCYGLCLNVSPTRIRTREDFC